MEAEYKLSNRQFQMEFKATPVNINSHEFYYILFRKYYSLLYFVKTMHIKKLTKIVIVAF